MQIILTTLAGDEAARKLARSLISNRLAACVNLLNSVESIYRWKGEIVEEPERILMIKCPRVKTRDCLEYLRDHHPYEVPELVVLDVAEVDAAYAHWLEESTSDK
ncbi:MAG: divalent-cation tolerance protein CutA [Candidatus Neomarinimicrobiota bacterium]|nr:MAG: divalent-cation tolerance protein CutA [Candidatus Neomarinimicrobiota bacterium]